MSLFDKYLIRIDQAIGLTAKDRQRYTSIYDQIRDYLMGIMRAEDIVFRQLFTGTTLFGSYSYNCRINKPTEFDVIFVLSFPFSNKIEILPDEYRPGFIKLDFSEVLNALENVNGYDDLYDLLFDWVDNDWILLDRRPFQSWLKELIKYCLSKYGYQFRDANGAYWELDYCKRGLAHTIRATCGNKKLSIDFVPGIKFNDCDWLDKSKLPWGYRFDKWYACPKPSHGYGIKVYSFLICNPEVENSILLDKQNLKVVLRLLKSLCKKKKMFKLRSYFLTTAFLWEIDNQLDSFWHEPVGDIFIHMLGKLKDYFYDQFLPFYWDEDKNLLDILTAEDIEEYGSILCASYNTLRTYEYQPKLRFQTCANHFKIRNYN